MKKAIVLGAAIFLCLNIAYSQIIYISPNSTGIGSKDDPAGIVDAFANLAFEGSHFRLDTGTYQIDYPLTLSFDDMIVEGGFLSSNNWIKTSEVGATKIVRSGLNSLGPTPERQGVTAIEIINDLSGFRIQDLAIDVKTPDPSTQILSMGYGVTTYGIKMTAADNYIISRVHMNVESGSSGDSSIEGSAGAGGQDGSPGMEAIGGHGGSGQSAGGPGGDESQPIHDETIDLDFETTTNALSASDAWQSFQPTKAGLLSKLNLHVQSNDPLNIRIYEGVGIDGTQLYSKSYNLISSVFHSAEFLLDSVIEVDAGNQYTVQLSGSFQWSHGFEIYSGGESSFDSSQDFSFQTYIMGIAEKGLDGENPLVLRNGGGGGGGGGRTLNSTIATGAQGGMGGINPGGQSTIGVLNYPYSTITQSQLNGGDGSQGQDGDDGLLIIPSFLESYYVGACTEGISGIGGSGGAGGTGAIDDDLTSSLSGAGGGGGGQGGLGASMSYGGGGTFGIYIFNNGANGFVKSCVINVGSGGLGGSGALGGTGGLGGLGGISTPSANICGNGGNGGNGGKGGDVIDAPDGDNSTVHISNGAALQVSEITSNFESYPIIFLDEAKYSNVLYTCEASSPSIWETANGSVDSIRIAQSFNSGGNNLEYDGNIYADFAVVTDYKNCNLTTPQHIIYVDQSAIGDNSGVDWSNALTDLQEAIEIAESCTDITDIYIAKGSYYPSHKLRLFDERYNTFYFRSGINLYGGFTGIEVDPSERPIVNTKLDPSQLTILNGDYGFTDDDFNNDGIVDNINDSLDNAYHLVLIEGVGDQLLFNGLAFTGGYANDQSGTDVQKSGGAVFNDGSLSPSNPQFKNCLFQGNIATAKGGAVFNIGNTTPIFIGCNFIKNNAYFEGGAVFNDVNSFPNPAFISNPYYYNCQFIGNQALLRGGAIANLAFQAGVCNSTIVQCLFAGNKSLSSGEGSCIHTFSLFGTSTTKVLNSTFAGNADNIFYDAYGAIEIHNSIIYSNQLNNHSTFEGIGNNVDIQYSIIQDTSETGSIYNFDPIFEDDYSQNNPTAAIPNTNGNYQLQTCSPALDLGNNDLYTSIVNDSLDFDGVARFREGYLSPTDYDPAAANIDLGPWEIIGPVYFVATKDSTDAYIDLFWEVNSSECSCLKEDSNLNNGVTVQLKSGATLIDSWIVFEEEFQDEPYIFTYRDEVGPNIIKDYILEFKQTGLGTLNCRQVEQGNTLPFRQVGQLEVSDGIRPDSIHLSWVNNSTLTDNFNIYRGTELIANIYADNSLGTGYVFEDVFTFTNGDFINGTTYDYCIQTVSDIYQDIYGTEIPDQSCDQGSSFDLNLEASDNLYQDKVSLTWTSSNQFTDQIRIIRDGEVIGVVEGSETSFDDLFPVFGRNSLYGIELLNENIPFVGSYDYGMVPANGIVSGRVITSQQKFPVKDAEITLNWTEEEVDFSSSTQTDFEGNFEFNNVYYNTANTFTVKVMKADEIFELDSLTVDLSLNNSTENALVFIMKKELVDDAQLLGVSNFSATADLTNDLVNISWDIQKTNSTDTVFFNLYRDSELITTSVNTDDSSDLLSLEFNDEGGTPEILYNYQLQAFQFNDGAVLDTSLNQPTIFPPVAPIISITSTNNTSLGSVTLNWTHESQNFKGYKVYRIYETENLIYSASANEKTFDDLSGIPDEPTAYYVTSFRDVNGISHESVPSDTIDLSYPNLIPINNILAQALELEDKVELSYFMPSEYQNTYAFDGVRIFRRHEGVEKQIAEIDKSLLTPNAFNSYLDKSGIPQLIYDYEVRPFKKNIDTSYELNGNFVTIQFPDVSLPLGLIATSQEGSIQLDWNSPHSSDNTNGFIIYKGTTPNIDSIGVLPYQYSNSFKDYTNNPPNGSNETYHVATVRYVDGVRYLSSLASVVANPPLVNGDEAIYLKNFTATKDQANHIKLCWDWCEPAIQTPFVIRRDGVIIDTLPYSSPTPSKTYYDFEALEGIDQEYSIESPGISNELTYQWVYATGKIPSQKSVLGRVFKEESYQGVQGVEIMVNITGETTGDISISKAVSDSSGYYQVSELPLGADENYSMEVSASGINSQIINSPSLIFIPSGDDRNIYEVDFIDQLIVAEEIDEVANIEKFNATPDPASMAVHLSWSPENNNFDGFELYRGVDLLVEVLKGEQLVWSDFEGGPGIENLYQIKAFKIDSEGKKYSDFKRSAATFPLLAPVEYLSVTPIPELNRIRINWSHPFDNHDLYTITRNGIPFDIVKTGNELIVIDSLGIPETMYNYEVIAFQGAYQSLPTSLIAQYPKAEPIKTFNLSSPSSLAPLAMDSIPVWTSENHLKLDWIYPKNAADSFMIVRYLNENNIKTDEQVVARVPGNEFSYRDYTGLPGLVYHYEIVVIINRANNEYFSERRSVYAESLIFPPLHPPTSMRVNPDTLLGMQHIDFFIDYNGVDGYLINRDGETIQEVFTSSFSEINRVEKYIDHTGIPEVEYQYEAIAFSKRADVFGDTLTFYSEPAIININYPDQPIPVNFAASNGLYPNKILLTWTYDMQIQLDEFVIERKVLNEPWEVIATMDVGARTYDDLDIEFSLPPDDYVEINYRIKAVNKGMSSAWNHDDGYLYNGILGDGLLVNERRLGHEIDIDDEWAIAGTNGHGFQIYHLQDDNSWSLHQVIDLSDAGIETSESCFGCQVSISGKYIIVSAQEHYQGKGSVYIYQRSSNNVWSLMKEIVQATTDQPKLSLGWDVDIYDDTGFGSTDYAAISNKGLEYEGEVEIYKRSGNDWILQNAVQGTLDFYEIFVGYDISLYKDRLAVALVNDLDFINIYEITPTSLNYIAGISGDLISSLDFDQNCTAACTYQLAFKGDYSFNVYAENSNSSYSQIFFNSDYTSDSNSISVKDNNVAFGDPTLNTVKLYDMPLDLDIDFVADPSYPNIEYGGKVALNNSFIMVSDVLANSGQGYVDFIPLETIAPPENIVATDGTQPGQVLVSWDEPNDSAIQSYKVFRDGQFLTSIAAVAPGNTLSYVDLPSSGLIPGKHYIYQVESFKSGIFSKSIGDEGWMPTNGLISGKLTTLVGNAPIENATVTASLFVDGDYLSFTDVTDALGNYEISDIYYGAASEVTLSCEYKDHEIISQESAGANPQLETIKVNLNLNTFTNGIANFFDKTAYAISGSVSHEQIENCYLDSIKLTRIYSIFQNGVRTRISEEKITDENGNYTFIINPETVGLDSILIEISDTKYLNVTNGTPQDSLCYNFDGFSNNEDVQNDHPDEPMYITNFILDKVTNLDFHDKTQYGVTINVVNTCGETLLNGNDQWTIRARSLDGCYEEYFQTSNGKTANFSVPPLDMVFTISDVSDYSSANVEYLDYLLNTPLGYNLASFHQNEAKQLSQQEITETLDFELIYHSTAVISADFSELEFLCNIESKEAIVQSGDTYTIPIQVSEEFDPVCEVTSGYLRIINGAAENTEQKVEYNPFEGKFDDYKFVAGSPNPVAPHNWNFKIEYYSDDGVFQGEKNHAIFVKGSISLPGNGILTDAGKSDEVPLPLLVLRDPPGDRSYSTIKKGHSSTKTYSFEDVSGGGAGYSTELSLTAVGVGVSAGVELSAGRYNGSKNELSITTELTEDLSTEAGSGDDVNTTGRAASIIVGAGIVMQYGAINTYDLVCDDSGFGGNILETKSIGFTPIELKTKWTYTVQFIENLIAGYEKDLVEIENGGLSFDDEFGNPLSKKDAIDKITSLKNNWEKIIEYYDVETDPIYNLVNTDYDDDNIFPRMIDSDSGNSLNFEAKLWAENLKTALNTSNGDKTLTQARLDKYNNAGTAIRELMHVRHLTDEDGEISQEAIDSTYQHWEFTSERWDDVNYYTTVPGINPNEMAENLTFSGLTNQTRSYNQSKSSSFSSNTNIYFNSDFNLGLAFDASVSTFVGLGGGVITKITGVKGEVGVNGTVNWYSNETFDDSNSSFQQIEYHLSDNDPTDEISVTVIKGLDPNHTPSMLFQPIGGETSCPHEEGTLAKDNPAIQVLVDGEPAKESSLFFVEDIAVFDITITNLSDAEETRDIEVFLDANSNPNGAKISLGGSNLSTLTYTDLEYNTPLQLQLTVERGVSFDYSGLRIGVRPTCADTIADYITLNVGFNSPCSSVSIVAPDNNWLINEQENSIIVKLRDYEPSTPDFDWIELQYRNLSFETSGLNSGWEKIDNTSIIPVDEDNNPVLQDILEAYNDGLPPGKIPEFKMVWTPDNGSSSLFPDGDYQIRAVAVCNEGTALYNETFSNYLDGIIDRSELQVLGLPEPSDGIWSPGDEISISFTKDINCSSLVMDSLRVFVADTLVENAQFSCYNNQIQVTVPTMSIYNGEIMTVVVDDVKDYNGNLAKETDAFGNVTSAIEWSFLVNTSKAYWEQDSIIVHVYEGETIDLEAGLRNADFQNPLNGLALVRSNSSEAWLSIVPDPSETFNINPSSVKPISLSFTGLIEGVSFDTLTVNNLVAGGILPKLPIKLITSKKPPYPPNWQVDGDLYPNSMTVVANYKVGDQGETSIDTLDQITAWIGNSLRGLGRIQKIGDEHVAYLTIYGSSSDNGELLEFRVWNQNLDIEYDAHADPQILYSDNAFEGSTYDPRILLINPEEDQARYIHLNQGYTWISFNSITTDMSVNKVLNELTELTPGDRVLGQNRFAEYFGDSAGWSAEPSKRLDNFSTENSYMVFLQNGPDSIRMTGINAPPFAADLLPGTNWVGFPSQESLLLEEAINVNDLSDVEQIKNKDISRISDGTNWTSGLLNSMVPNEGYKIFLSSQKVVSIPSLLGLLLDNESSYKSLLMAADPNDESTWSIDLEEYAYTDVIPVVGRMMSNQDTISGDGNRKIAAFIDGDLRGVGLISNISELEDQLFTLLIGKNDLDNNAEVNLYYYDGTTVSDSLNMDIALLTNNGHGLFNYINPLIWDTMICPDHLVLTIADSPLNGNYEAKQTITVDGNLMILNESSVILNAPDVTINGLETQLGSTFEVLQVGCN